MTLIDVLVPVRAGPDPGELDRRLFAIWGQEHRPLAVHLFGPGADARARAVALQHGEGVEGLGWDVAVPVAGSGDGLEAALAACSGPLCTLVPEGVLLYPEALGALLAALLSGGTSMVGAPLRRLVAERHAGFDYPLGVIEAGGDAPLLRLVDRGRISPRDLAALLAPGVASGPDVDVLEPVVGDLLEFDPAAAEAVSRMTIRHWP